MIPLSKLLLILETLLNASIALASPSLQQIIATMSRLFSIVLKQMNREHELVLEYHLLIEQLQLMP